MGQVGTWSDLSGTLRRLEALAAHPDELDERSLRRLQYSLHRASELAEGELAAALVDARDLTAEVAEADEPALLVHEWRGSLFRVRLARQRATAMVQPAPEPKPKLVGAVAACLLVTAGAAIFAVGAVWASWPLWTLGIALVAGAFLAYRP